MRRTMKDFTLLMALMSQLFLPAQVNAEEHKSRECDKELTEMCKELIPDDDGATDGSAIGIDPNLQKGMEKSPSVRTNIPEPRNPERPVDPNIEIGEPEQLPEEPTFPDVEPGFSDGPASQPKPEENEELFNRIDNNGVKSSETRDDAI